VLPEQHTASRTNVRLVLLKLAAQGLIEAKHGKACFLRQKSKSAAGRRVIGLPCGHIPAFAPGFVLGGVASSAWI
jgi:DNA-binding FadR family transcriptional regulator